MAPKNHNSLQRCCWLTGLLSVMLMFHSIRFTNAAAPRPSGYMTPKGPLYVSVNKTLSFVCGLNQPSDTNSRHLSFTDRGMRLQNVVVLNATAIQVHIPTDQMDTPVITCKVNEKGIGYSEVFIGLPPTEIRDFRCISNNFESFNCTFKFDENPILTNYNVTYGMPGASYTYHTDLQPFVNLTQPDYWFNVPNYSSVRDLYEFQFFMRNKLGSLNQSFVVNNFESVRAAPPSKLEINTTTNVLSWEIHEELLGYEKDVHTEIIVESDYDKREPIRERIKKGEATTHKLENLTAYTWYRVQIRIRLSCADQSRDELWSDYALYEFETSSRTPDHPPATDIGAFSVNDLNDVVIFWRQLRIFERNAANASYIITKSVAGVQKEMLKADISATMLKMQNTKPYETLEFEIHSSNALGLSQRASHVKVPKKAERVGYPTELKKNRNGTSYKLTWGEPVRNAKEITSYTVFWCKSKSELPNQCEGSIDFRQVDASTKSFQIDTAEGINFAVSANTDDSSSGMVWALCTASESDDIGKLKTVWVSSITSNSMEIQWSLDCVDRPILRYYNMSYCQITSPTNVTCREGTQENRTISSNQTHYKITNLKPYTTYSTTITMNSDTRTGPPCEPLMNTTYEATPSSPRNLDYSEVKNNSVLLHWDAPENLNGVLKNYEVAYNSSRRDFYVGGKGNVTLLLDHLESYQTYEIVVSACSNCCNCSVPSNTIKIRTAIGTPGPVFLLASNNDLEKKVNFTWSPPAKKAGLLDFYEVQIIDSATNTTHLRRTRNLGCILDVTPATIDSSFVKEQKWEVYVRAVNVLFSPHAKRHSRFGDEDASSARYQRHSSLGTDRPQAQSLEVMDQDSGRRATTEYPVVDVSGQVTTAASAKIAERWSCLEDDEEVLKFPLYDRHLQELPGPWSPKYEHVSGSTSIVWKPVVASIVFLAMIAFTGVYLYKKFFRLKKGVVVLPPGLTDIAAKPIDSKGSGGVLGFSLGNGPGLMGHGNGMIIGTDTTGSRSHIRPNVDASLFDEKCNNGGGNCSANSSPQLTFDERQLVNGVKVIAHSETNSLHEQEQSLLVDDRMDAQSSASCSSSSMMMMEEEHEEDDEEEAPVLAQPQLQQQQPHRLGMQHDVLAAMVNSKQQQQLQHQLQQMHHQPMPQTVIKPASNGYVTIAQRSDGYTKLGDLIKPMEMAPGTAGDQGITGYVTHKQLADFGHRLQ